MLLLTSMWYPTGTCSVDAVMKDGFESSHENVFLEDEANCAGGPGVMQAGGGRLLNSKDGQDLKQMRRTPLSNIRFPAIVFITV